MTDAIGRSVRLFLVEGKSTGLITAEIMNWTGHVLTGPRTELPKFLARPEVARTGVYLLHGRDPDDPDRTMLYIGESDQVGARLKQHNQEDLLGAHLRHHQQGPEHHQGARALSGVAPDRHRD
ncbi:hypothetical protein [Halochromatium roseum]|uniref:hypothetical protein n=1 Tax=Halochromatium roseum TaxID=391920 RepID=UPI0030840690